MEFVERCKTWKWKEDVTVGIFEGRVQTRASFLVEEPSDVEGVWN